MVREGAGTGVLFRLREVEDRDEEHAAGCVAENRRDEKVQRERRPRDRPAEYGEHRFGGPDDAVRKIGGGNDVDQRKRDEEASCRASRREVEPYHARHEPAGEHGLPEDIRPGQLHEVLAVVKPDIDHRSIEHARRREHPGARSRAEQVGEQDHGPDANEARDAGAPREHEGDGRQRVLGEQLISAHHHKEKADRIHQPGDQRGRLPAQPRLDGDNGEEGQADGETGREAAEEKKSRRPGELMVRLGHEPTKQLVRREPIANHAAGVGCRDRSLAARRIVPGRGTVGGRRCIGRSTGLGRRRRWIRRTGGGVARARSAGGLGFGHRVEPVEGEGGRSKREGFVISRRKRDYSAGRSVSVSRAARADWRESVARSTSTPKAAI